MKFVGIWFDMDREVKRDVVNASDSNEASDKIHLLYRNGNFPAPCLTVTPLRGYESWDGDASSTMMQLQGGY